MRDIAQFLLLVWVAVCTTLAGHYRARFVEELETGLDAERSGSSGSYTAAGKKYRRRFVITVVVGLAVFAVVFLLLVATST